MTGAAPHILVTGASGLLGREFVPAARRAGARVTALSRRELDITDRAAVLDVVRRERPTAIVNLAAYTQVDRAEEEGARAHAVNGEGPGHLAAAAEAVGAVMVQMSTDYIFSGKAAVPYTTEAPPAPLNRYGLSKLAGEVAVREQGPNHLIIRTSWLFGAGGPNFVDSMVALGRKALESGQPLRVVEDQRSRPTWTRSLAGMMVGLIGRGVRGTIHATNGGEASWYALACETLRLAGIRAGIRPVPSTEFPRPARRPASSVLDLTRLTRELGSPPLHWRVALARYLTDDATASTSDSDGSLVVRQP